jgi:ParB/RepB/Spo0J family partition protein
MSGVNLGVYKLVKLDEIIFDLERRGRTDYGDILELQQSIKDHGLFQPLIVYSKNAEAPYELLGGGRRFLACTALGLDMVPVRIFNVELSDAEKKVVELFENLHRADLSWYDEVSMKEQLNDLLSKSRGNKHKHTQADTARLLKESKNNVGLDLKLARAMREFPELNLRAAKNKHTAMQMFNRFMVAFKNRIVTNEAVRQLEQEKPEPTIVKVEVTADKLVEHREQKVDDKALALRREMIDAYKLGDFFDYKHIENQFSFIEVDPPYGIELDVIKKQNKYTPMNPEYEEVDPEVYNEFLLTLLSKCYTLATEDAWLIIWFGAIWTSKVYEALEKTGWEANIVPAVWIKANNPGQTNSPNTNLGSAYESFYYARKGKMQLYKRGRANVFNFAPVTRGGKIHPTEKPRALLREIISVFSWPKSRVLVPFAGSGVTLHAAYEAGLSAVGHDKSREFREAYIAQVIEETKQMRFA